MWVWRSSGSYCMRSACPTLYQVSGKLRAVRRPIQDTEPLSSHCQGLLYVGCAINWRTAYKLNCLMWDIVINSWDVVGKELNIIRKLIHKVLPFHGFITFCFNNGFSSWWEIDIYYVWVWKFIFNNFDSFVS